MAENTSSYTLNLDAEQFTSAARSAAHALTGISEAGESIGHLVEVLESVSVTLGILTVGFFAVKEAFESVFEGEKIAQTTSQFNALSAAAGVYGDTLKKGLQEASNGWVTDTELMQHANRAMSELEVGVEKLPQLMETARKATAVMGGDFMENFDKMTQAVATHSAHRLRSLGITIDEQKALRGYAGSIDVAVGSLSQAGKQQAILNAILDATKDKYKGQNEDLIKNLSLWQQIKTNLKDLGEIIEVVFAKFASPAVTKFMTSLHDSLVYIKQDLLGITGTGTERFEVLEQKVNKTKEALDRMGKANRDAMSPTEVKLLDNAIADTTKQLQLQEAELNKLKTTDQSYLTEQKQHQEQLAQMAGAANKSKSVDQDAERKQRAAFQKESVAMDRELQSINKQITNEEIKNMDSVEQAEKLYDKKRLQAGKDVETQITAVKAKEAELRSKLELKEITRPEYAVAYKKLHDQEVALNHLKNQRIEKDDAELAHMQQQALDNYVRKSSNAFDGIARSFKAMANKNKAALSDWGRFGTMTTEAFAQSSTSAIQQWALGQKSATDAVEGMFASMVGKMATQQGEMMLLSSILPPNPAAAAGGIALIALGAKLGAMGSGVSGGGGSFSGGGAYSAGGGSGNSMTSPSSDSSLPSSAASQTQNGPSSVHLVVQGSVFDTDSTRTRIADLVRQSMDATDFSIQKVGGGV